MSDNGLVTRQSAHDVPTTLARLTAALDAKGVTIFARIDHAAGAYSVGLTLRPTTVVIFGNPAAGTPLMQAARPPASICRSRCWFGRARTVSRG